MTCLCRVSHDLSLPTFQTPSLLPYPRLPQDHFHNSFHRMFNDYGFLAFFKRSYVQKRSGDPVGIHRESGSRDLPNSHWPMRHNYLPFAYGVARRYMAGLWGEQGLMAYDDGKERDIPVVCTLREYHKPAWPGGRENVSAWLTEMAIEGAVLGEVSDWQEGNRHQNNGPYLDAMRRAQIVVTSNPGDWEGDFRLWEAMATKALVFVDYMYVSDPRRGMVLEAQKRGPISLWLSFLWLCETDVLACLRKCVGTCQCRTSSRTVWTPSFSTCTTSRPSWTRSAII